MLWDLNEGKHLYTLDGGDIINALCFSPNRYWLCAATGPSIKIWVRGSLIFIPPRPDPCGIPPKKTYFPQTWGFAGFGATFVVQICLSDLKGGALLGQWLHQDGSHTLNWWPRPRPLLKEATSVP